MSRGSWSPAVQVTARLAFRRRPERLVRWIGPGRGSGPPAAFHVCDIGTSSLPHPLLGGYLELADDAQVHHGPRAERHSRSGPVAGYVPETRADSMPVEDANMPGTPPTSSRCR